MGREICICYEMGGTLWEQINYLISKKDMKTRENECCKLQASVVWEGRNMLTWGEAQLQIFQIQLLIRKQSVNPWAPPASSTSLTKAAKWHYGDERATEPFCSCWFSLQARSAPWAVSGNSAGLPFWSCPMTPLQETWFSAGPGAAGVVRHQPEPSSGNDSLNLCEFMSQSH